MTMRLHHRETGPAGAAAGLWCALGVVAGCLAAPVALAQTSAVPPPPAAGTATSPAAPKVAPPRATIQLSPSERKAIDAAETAKEPATRVEDALVPTAEDMKPHADAVSSVTRIEQTRTSNRVSEVIVTPAGRSSGYVMQNREGRQPYGTLQMNSGLSVPMFLRFEFGKPTPGANIPPPNPPPSR